MWVVVGVWLSFALTLAAPLFSDRPCETFLYTARAGQWSNYPRDFLPQCTDDGLYAPLQCWITEQTCWCVDPLGKEIPETRSHISLSGLLDCSKYRLCRHHVGELSPRLRRRAAARHRALIEPQEESQGVLREVPEEESGEEVVTRKPQEHTIVQQDDEDVETLQLVQRMVGRRQPFSPRFLSPNRIVFGARNEEERGGNSQLFTLEIKDGKAYGVPQQITHEAEPVTSFVPRPGFPSQLLFFNDHKGNEHRQITLLDVETGARTALTEDPDAYHTFGGFQSNGMSFSYIKIKASETKRTLYLYKFEDDSHTPFFTYDDPVDVGLGPVSPDQRHVVVSVATNIPGDSELFLLDVTAGVNQTPLLLTENRGKSDPSAWSAGSARFHPTKPLLYALTNHESEYTHLRVLSTRNAFSPTVLLEFKDAEIDSISIPSSHCPLHIAAVVDHNGVGEFHLYRVSDDGLRAVEMSNPLNDQGILTSPLVLAPDFSSAVLVKETLAEERSIVLLHIKEGRGLTVHTLVEAKPADPTVTSLPVFKEFKYMSGGVKIFAYDLPPDPNSIKGGKIPYVVLIHGGPKSAHQPKMGREGSVGIALTYLRTKGVGVLLPNIRGSLGYGKTFSLLDNREKRDDAVQDVLDAVIMLSKRSDVDKNRIAIMGGSYGGWMTLKAAVTRPDLFAAAVELFGMSNMETFMKNTAPFRRRDRELEYGSSPELLRRLSPIHNACKMARVPLLVLQGKNDIRVPESEANQILEAVKQCGGIAEGEIFEGEGHGFTQDDNKKTGAMKIIQFLKRTLRL